MAVIEVKSREARRAIKIGDLRLPLPETIGDNRLFTVITIDNFEGLDYAYLTIELVDNGARTVVFYKLASIAFLAFA